MRQSLAIAALSVLAFGAGYGVRVWVDATRPLPRPPGALMSEFAASKPPVPTPARAPNRADLAAQIELLRPQMDAYRAQLAEINAEFERSLELILTPEQAAHHAETVKRNAAAPRPQPPGTKDDHEVLTDEQINWLQQRSLYTMFRNIALQMSAEAINKDLKLDAGQQEKLRVLLQKRREQFLALVDSAPPPSLLLMNLAYSAQHLVAPKADLAAAPKP